MFIFDIFQNFLKMDPTIEVPEDKPFFSVLDFILLTVLLGGAAWWLLKNKKKEAPATIKSYSIQ